MKCIDQMLKPMAIAPPINDATAARPCALAHGRQIKRLYDTATATAIERQTSQEV